MQDELLKADTAPCHAMRCHAMKLALGICESESEVSKRLDQLERQHPSVSQPPFNTSAALRLHAVPRREATTG